MKRSDNNIVRDLFVNLITMEKAVAFDIQIDYGHILFSLEKLRQSALPSDEKRFEKVLRLWVSVYTKIIIFKVKCITILALIAKNKIQITYVNVRVECQNGSQSVGLLCHPSFRIRIPLW